MQALKDEIERLKAEKSSSENVIKEREDELNQTKSRVIIYLLISHVFDEFFNFRNRSRHLRRHLPLTRKHMRKI